jgi:tRNA threonylcarbamoyladenosine biosynthesis protein TsaB
MRLLAIECSTEWLSVATAEGEAVRERREHALQSHSQRVLPLVAELLAEAGWTLGSLEGIAFGAGPGSFTGVRIACGVAQGLALGASLPVVPVTTLLALADDAARAHGATRVATCIDARMREIYVAAYERRDDRWHEALAPAVVKPGAVEFPPGRWFGAGNGFDAYPSLAQRQDVHAQDASLVPSAAAVARLALPRLASGEGVAPEHALPLYVRHRVALTSAERAAGATL